MPVVTSRCSLRICNEIDQFLPVAVVGINDRDSLFLFRLRGELKKQFRLGVEVIFHRPVKVEMILRKIGENRDIPLDSAGPFLRQRMRRNFHRSGTPSGVNDLR